MSAGKNENKDITRLRNLWPFQAGQNGNGNICVVVILYRSDAYSDTKLLLILSDMFLRPHSIRIRIRFFCRIRFFLKVGSGSDFFSGSDPDPVFSRRLNTDPHRIRNPEL